MKCPACGHENRENARFCGECAASLSQEVSCPRCGNLNPSQQKFCDSCGHGLGAPVVSEVSRDPRSYTPKHLAEKILTSRSALEGERKTITYTPAVSEPTPSRKWARFLCNTSPC